MSIAAYRGFAQTLLSGEGALNGLAAELASLGVGRVAVLTSPSVARLSAFARLTAQLAGLEVVATFTTTRPHAPIVDTEALVARLREAEPQALVCLGGGSVSDTGKACAVVLGEGGRLEDHCSTFTPPDQLVQPALAAPKIPVIAVPTTLSGAEMTPGAGATDADDVKRVFWDPQVAARVVIFDARILAESPADLLVTTAMNGLAHCAEGLYSRAKNPVSSALALRGAGLFARGLAQLAAGPGERAALDRLGEAAALSGMVISHARVGLHHAVCHVLGAYCGLAHGTANAVMLPYALAYNEPETSEEQRQLADAVIAGLRLAGAEAPDRSATSAAAAVTALQRVTGAPTSLQEVGVDHAMLDEVAERTMRDRGLFFNPRRVRDVSEVRDVLEQAFTAEPSRV